MASPTFFQELKICQLTTAWLTVQFGKLKTEFNAGSQDPTYLQIVKYSETVAICFEEYKSLTDRVVEVNHSSDARDRIALGADISGLRALLGEVAMTLETLQEAAQEFNWQIEARRSAA